jgi:succinate dehydrogenase / fumarate reductase flavoprotein subunit
LADGYFVLPYTIGDYLARLGPIKVSNEGAAFGAVTQESNDKMSRLLGINGSRTVDTFHRELGKMLLDKCGMARSKAGLEETLQKIPPLREEFWQDVKVTGTGEMLNQDLEKAGRVADFLEFGELMCYDALTREESCGGHFREEHQTEEGEAKRNDEEFAYVAAWEFTGVGSTPNLHKEPLTFTDVPLSQRSYK